MVILPDSDQGTTDARNRALANIAAARASVKRPTITTPPVVDPLDYSSELNELISVRKNIARNEELLAEYEPGGFIPSGYLDQWEYDRDIKDAKKEIKRDRIRAGSLEMSIIDKIKARNGGTK